MEPTLQEKIQEIGKGAKTASRQLALLSNGEKNAILAKIQEDLIGNIDYILEENQKDLEEARKNSMKESLIDRLLLTKERMRSMAQSIDTLLGAKDPVGKVLSMDKMDNGLLIGKKTVPIGVLAIIYESRPNVTLDAAILAIKSGNAIILRGGKEAFFSNMAIGKSIRQSIGSLGYLKDMVCLIPDTSRASSHALMEMKEYVDLLIPRGSQSLIQTVVEHAKMPTLETGVGNCHLYIDKYANKEMALKIFENAKTSRTGVCNAIESLLIHRDIGEDFYPQLEKIVQKHGITIHGDEEVAKRISGTMDLSEDDYGKEYLQMELSIAIVDSMDQAISHIQRYSTGHSESIVTEDYQRAMDFLNRVDSACVYVNASTRFTDGGEFGLGAEMGISTQKIHARGPVGIGQLTSTKYVILGNGQIRV